MEKEFQPLTVIAIDGPAGSGKSTAARMLAEHLGYLVLDTGALYRSTAVCLIRLGLNPDAVTLPDNLSSLLDLRINRHMNSLKLSLGKEDVTELIRQDWVGVAASKFAARSEVRAALLGLQRSIGTRWNIVAEGRDMGTVVFPDAPVKFFLYANLRERAKRRYAELIEKGNTVTLETVLSDMCARDSRDESRSHAPLAKAVDAVGLDTTDMDREQVLEFLVKVVESRTGAHS